jgi:cytochrome oxidase Cu insertion factor (SCO1/SenC/PrrC family)
MPSIPRLTKKTNIVLEFIYYRCIDICTETGKFNNHHGLFSNKLRDARRRCIRAEL